DRAELAGAGAYRTHQHQGRGAAAPAFGDVRAFRFRADGRQLVAADDVADFLVFRARGELNPQPWRLALGIGKPAQLARPDAVLDRAGPLRARELAARQR